MKYAAIILAALLAACAPAAAEPASTEPQIVFITPTPTAMFAAAATDEPLPFRDIYSPTPLPTATPMPAPTLTPSAAAPASAAPTLPASSPTSAPIVSAPALVPIVQPVADVASAEQAVIDLTNARRSQFGLPPLARSETIMEIARARSADMVARNYFGHDDPMTGAHIAREAVTASGYGRAGENIYWSGRGALSDFPAQAVQWFMDDPPHRANILNSGYTAIGVGIAWNGVGWVLTQDFGG